MADFYISAIKMDGAGQHIEFVKVHKNLGTTFGPGRAISRAFIGELIQTGRIEFRTITKTQAQTSWSIGAKVEVTAQGYITTHANKTTLDNLGNLPTF
ncbi:DUF3892 domain-containing protein [Pantoea stewartii]|uniref:DUF3892 domain-containing protein n=1 Tax=Pantoea stewartii TaxID=66269 RepID=UPI002DBD88E1|nr:DUF3892 domain-containing protein [Pantoea stewartii]MEB6537269.1 DUF3892 domain-containing protein [Pantoea stewartii]